MLQTTAIFDVAKRNRNLFSQKTIENKAVKRPFAILCQSVGWLVGLLAVWLVAPGSAVYVLYVYEYIYVSMQICFVCVCVIHSRLQNEEEFYCKIV